LKGQRKQARCTSTQSLKSMLILVSHHCLLRSKLASPSLSSLWDRRSTSDLIKVMEVEISGAVMDRVIKNK
jgi:hypothetical protein